MSDLQGRGYLIVHYANYLRDSVSEAEWKQLHEGFSFDLKQLLGGHVKPAGWYSISLLNEVTDKVASIVGKGQDDTAREALHVCGRYVAREATNTFLRIMMKMLTPTLFVRKLPDIFRRDFTRGRLEVQLNGSTLTGTLFDAPNFNHAIVTSTGFVATALEGMGKTVEGFSVYDWSVAQPIVDGTRFEITWRD